MKFRIYLFALCILGAQSVVAQNEVALRGGGGGFSIGYANMDVSAFEEFIQGEAKRFTNDQLLFGGGGRSFIGNFIIGGSGQGLIGDTHTDDSLKMSLAGGMGTLDIGYLVYNREQLKIYPMLGLGGGGYEVQITQNENISADEVRQDPGREITVGTGGFLADISLNMNVLPIIEQSEDGSSYGGFSIGLSAGYTYGVRFSEWGFAGGDISGGPDFNMDMFYVKVTIGGMGFEK
ncbi:hypothetical protein [Halocola ammonii]